MCPLAQHERRADGRDGRQEVDELEETRHHVQGGGFLMWPAVSHFSEEVPQYGTIDREAIDEAML